MSLITNHELVRIHVEELRREVERHHLVGRRRYRGGLVTRVRTAAGGWLIAVGNGLLPHPPPDWSAPALGHAVPARTQRRMF